MTPPATGGYIRPVKRLYWSAFVGLQALRQRGFAFRLPEEVRREQTRRLRRVVLHAWRFVPYYREMFRRLDLGPDDFRSVEDLARLPVLERRDIQTDPERFHSEALRRRTCYAIQTGGSTGAPISVRHELGAMLETAVHGQRYQEALAEAPPGRPSGSSRETWIFPSFRSNVHLYRQAWREHTILDRRPLASRQYIAMTEPFERVVELLNEYGPDVVHTYGSYLEALFAHLDKAGTPVHRFRAAGFGADGLSGQARRLLEERFGIPAFSLYAAVEAPSMGFECREHRGLHMNEDLYPVRLVDGSGRAVVPGERGEVVVSNLVNRAMVLLNYRLGDLAALLPGPCPCGRSLPMMSYPEGRSYDWFELPSGRSLTAFAVNQAFRDEPGVLQYQLVQEDPRSYRIAVVVREPFDLAAFEARAAARLAGLVGEPVALRAATVPAIARTETGKVRPFISMCRGASPAAPET